MSDGESDRLLTPEEAADLLAMTADWVRERSRDGTLPALKLGRYWRYRREALLAWVESCSQSGRPRLDR